MVSGGCPESPECPCPNAGVAAKRRDKVPRQNSKERLFLLCNVGNCFRWLVLFMVGIKRTARLSGGMETGQTALSWGKGLVSFQKVEKSNIPATVGRYPIGYCTP